MYLGRVDEQTRFRRSIGAYLRLSLTHAIKQNNVAVISWQIRYANNVICKDRCRLYHTFERTVDDLVSHITNITNDGRACIHIKYK